MHCHTIYMYYALWDRVGFEIIFENMTFCSYLTRCFNVIRQSFFLCAACVVNATVLNT